MFFSAAHANDLTEGMEFSAKGITYIYRPRGEEKIHSGFMKRKRAKSCPPRISLKNYLKRCGLSILITRI
jgi:hypothetical protein